MLTHRIIEIRTGAYYSIGGGLYGHTGFIGCMRRIVIDGQYKPPTSWKMGEEIMDEDVIIDSCGMTDRCNPNPCEHGGVCKQNSKDFFCECEDTGYTGAVCHTSLNWFSCVQFQNKHPESRYKVFLMVYAFHLYTTVYVDFVQNVGLSRHCSELFFLFTYFHIKYSYRSSHSQ